MIEMVISLYGLMFSLCFVSMFSLWAVHKSIVSQERHGDVWGEGVSLVTHLITMLKSIFKKKRLKF